MIGETLLSFNIFKQEVYRETVALAASVTKSDVIITKIMGLETRRRRVIMQLPETSNFLGIRVSTSISALTAQSAETVVENLAKSVSDGDLARTIQSSGLAEVSFIGIGSIAVGGDYDNTAAQVVKTSTLVASNGNEVARKLSEPITTAPSNNVTTTISLPIALPEQSEESPFVQSFIDLGEDKDAMGGVAIAIGMACAFVVTVVLFFIRKARLKVRAEKMRVEDKVGKDKIDEENQL